MTRTLLSNARIVGCLSFALMAVGAFAQNSPPIKPGLWEVKSQREMDGKSAPDPVAMMKNLPPEVRQRMEATMKQRGVDISGNGGAIKMCMDKNSLDKGRWQGAQGSCKTDIKTRSADRWTWHAVCSEPPSESDGEAVFKDPENYTVKTTTSLNIMGQPRKTTMAIDAKWLGADCGDLKPVRPPSSASSGAG